MKSYARCKHFHSCLADAIEAKKKELGAMPNVDDKIEELEVTLANLNKQLFDKRSHNQDIERKKMSLENTISRKKGDITSVSVQIA